MLEHNFQFMQDREILEKLKNEFEKNKKLKNLYIQLINDFDFKVLKSKSKSQIVEIKKLYFGRFSIFNPKKHLIKKDRLIYFTKFVNSLKPAEDFTAQRLGIWQRMVKSQNLKVANFNVFANLNSKDFLDLKSNKFKNKIQIQFCEIETCHERSEEMMKKYLNNLFDYQSGLKILSYYLALVFRDEKEAINILSNKNKDFSEKWDLKPNKFSGKIIEQMKIVLSKTGIEPPFGIKIRIHA